MQINEKQIEAAARADAAYAGRTFDGLSGVDKKRFMDRAKLMLEAAMLTDAEPVAWRWKYKDSKNWVGVSLDAPNEKQPSLLIIEPLYAVPSAPAVTVKALEWNPFEAETTFDTHYRIWEGESGKYRCNLVEGYFLTTKEAKAAAQADYEARIRSALTQVQDVAATQTFKIGIYGKAYDGPYERRAYTHDEQPDNIASWKLGRACSKIHSGGDFIDWGLSLLNALQREGFGVFEIPAPTAKQGEPE